jgi:hypothetical protein
MIGICAENRLKSLSLLFALFFVVIGGIVINASEQRDYFLLFVSLDVFSQGNGNSGLFGCVVTYTYGFPNK